MTWPQWRPVFTLGALALCVMLFQVTLIHGARAAFLSDIQFYVIPLTLLGLGLGGVAAYFRSETRRVFFMFALLVPLPYLFLHFAYTYSTLSTALFLLSAAVVFALAGWIIASFLKYYSDRVAVFIGADLVGAGIGAFLAIALLNSFGYVATVCITIAGAWLAYCLAEKLSLRALFAVVPLALLLVPSIPSSLVGVTCPLVQNPVVTASNSIAEVAAQKRPLERVHELGKTSQGSAASYLIMMNCAAGATTLVSGTASEVAFLGEDFRSIPLAWWSETHDSLGRVFVPSAGAGIDVMRSLLFNPSAIDATEFNPTIITISKSLSHPDTYPYADPRVQLFQGDTRRFLAQSDDSYDLVLNYLSSRFGSLAGVVDTPNYSVAGEMLALHFSRLAPGGVLVMVGPPGNSVIHGPLQVFAAGNMSAEGRLVYVKGTGKEDMSLAKKTPFTREELLAMRRIVSERGFEMYAYGENGFPQLRGGVGGVTNNRPYAYFTSGDIDFFTPETFVRHAYLALGGGITVLILLSFWIARRSRVPFSLVSMASLYAALIGIGFITFELWAIQRMFIALADPTISFAVTVASLLIFGGLGSMSFRLIPRNYALLYVVVGTLGILLFSLFAYPSDTFLNTIAAQSLILRISLVVGYLAFPSFVLGIFLPAILSHVGNYTSLVPLVWGIDGLFAVVGGFIAKALFHTEGLSSAFPVVALFYTIAAVCFIGFYFRNPAQDSPVGYSKEI